MVPGDIGSTRSSGNRMLRMRGLICSRKTAGTVRLIAAGYVKPTSKKWHMNRHGWGGGRRSDLRAVTRATCGSCHTKSPEQARVLRFHSTRHLFIRQQPRRFGRRLGGYNFCLLSAASPVFSAFIMTRRTKYRPRCHTFSPRLSLKTQQRPIEVIPAWAS